MGALETESATLDPLLRGLPEVLVHSRADGTVNSYYSSYSMWRRWAIKLGVSPLPAKPLTLGLYLLSRIQNGDSYAVCKSSFYGIRYIHNMHFHPDPTQNAVVVEMLQAAKRLDMHVVQKKEPITVEILSKLYEQLMGMPLCLSKVRTMCMCIMGFSGFLRFDELSNIRKGDITFFTTHMTVFIEKGKTDQYRDGRTLYISRSVAELCPVEITIKYLVLAGLHREVSGDLTPSDSDEEDGTCELFIFRGISTSKNGKRLRKANKSISYTRVRELLLEELKRVGVDQKAFGTHSLRSGGASAAANAGVPDRLFKRHGRWASEGAKDGYVKDNVERLLSVSRSLGL